MALWEYKVISSGKGGFATPVLLEKFLNDLGKEQWEIIDFRTAPDNPLAFSGLARRPTQRDWTLEDAAAAAAKAEADKMRAEFEAKFKGMAPAAAAATEDNATASALDEKAAPDDGFRQPIDTSHDQDPDADDEDEARDEWDQLVEEDQLPTFFEAIRPHMRRNQRGPGMSVGVDYLAKKWGFDEADVTGALKECGFEIPDDENAKPAYLDYDGDLYWVNINRRGELWINTKEKPLPVFRVVPGQPVEVEEESKGDKKPKPAEPHKEHKQDKKAAKEPAKEEKTSTPTASLPEGSELLKAIRPKMRRNRDNAGGSGSTSFLSRAFKRTEAELLTAFASLGLVPPEKDGAKPARVTIDGEQWWLQRDKRGSVWINVQTGGKGAPAQDEKPGDDAKSEEKAPEAATEMTPVAQPSGASAPDDLLVRVRPLLKRTRTGAEAAEVAKLAAAVELGQDDFVAALVGAGLKVPEKPREKPVFVERGGEIFWFNLNAKGQLWLNAKASKYAGESDAATEDDVTASTEKKSRRPRSRKKPVEQPTAEQSGAGQPAAEAHPDEPSPAESAE